jgi:tetratricopeptide (TPR) repeat protein
MARWTSWKHQARSRPPALTVSPPVSRWLYHPAVDLIVGCGAWSAPLLLVASRSAPGATRSWAVLFYLLALALNYPHYMATVYRAYHTRTEFEKYRLFTFHITAFLVVMGAASHIWAPLASWIFTLYVTWSPWHYTGQNFGLVMMFARRNGVPPTDRERRALYLAFLASYALLFITFHTGPSSDPLVHSLGIPAAVAAPVRRVLLLLFGALVTTVLVRMLTRSGLGAMLAPLTLVSTQCLWFVIPTLAQWLGGAQVQQTRYSTGVLAVMHSAQYLWITSYYARREAESEHGGAWRPWSYAATLLAGGIALFVPGPWVTSYLFGVDFTRSVLVFTAIVNIHHFLLDGAVWKLRDGRIAALLVDSRRQAAESALEAGRAVRLASAWLAGPSSGARAVRVATLVVLCVWAALDQTRFVLGTSADSLPALRLASTLNPHDTAVQQRKARLLINDRRFQEAYDDYQAYLIRQPQDVTALVNAGVLAMQLGMERDAVRKWQTALDIDPALDRVPRYLAQFWAGRADVLERAGQTEDAGRAYRSALTFDERGGDDAASGVDWFNYGQFLRRRDIEPRIVMACLLHAETLLARGSGGQLETVRSAQAEVERAHPGATSAARQAQAASVAEALARYPAGLAP